MTNSASNSMRLILGSSSPRREQLLGSLGLQFEIVKSRIEEVMDPELPPETLVVDLARQKAEDVMAIVLSAAPEPRAAGPGAPEGRKTLVLGADTIVVFEGKYLGKPVDKDDAKA
ncbi:MAG TPA: Maf family protein, partial [Chroococcales cyanobacterium]